MKKERINSGEKKYLNITLPIQERVEDLINKLTLQEKVSLIFNINPEIERLNIPTYDWRNEALQGLAFQDKSTIFPQAIGMAATWNENLILELADAISNEARARHHEYTKRNKRERWCGLTFSTPNINIFRDPRWGRGQETFGEDPYLTSRMAVAFCKGLQGNHPKYIKVCAEPKHFVVHSGPEKLRHEIDNIVSKKDLYETYLPAFEACIKEGKAEGIMGAYNRLNGEACCASKTLLEKILRDKFGFKGYVIADGGAVRDIFKYHKLVGTFEEASALALNNGLDIINPFNLATRAKLKMLRRKVLSAVQENLVSEEVIEKALKRVLKARFKLGMFDPSELVPFARIPYNVIDCKDHRNLALRTAQESLVLLKNENNFLPLSKNIRKIGAIGPLADNPLAFYYPPYYPNPPEIVTYLEGLKNRVGFNTKVYYEKGCEIKDGNTKEIAKAIELADNSDIICLFLGITGEIEGEEGYVVGLQKGDRTDLNIPDIQYTLFKKITELNKPVVLILTSGSALSINYAKQNENILAIIQAFYPGEEGGNALADTLFGNVNPCGRLPITFYQSIQEIPEFTDYNMKNRTYRYFKGEPLYYFGYGLSYSIFKYQNLEIHPKFIQKGEELNIDFDVYRKKSY
ncbi:MAG: glycoside hydrolase family 3 C-terminal domain-containing protein [Candidatus Lokiarchaeota archaeon]